MKDKNQRDDTRIEEFLGYVNSIIATLREPFLVLYTATLITAKAVIPAPYQVRGKLQQESRKTLDSGSSPE